MKKILVFLTGMVLFMQHGQAQFKRHYWLNPASVNYTLSYPTSNGEWMQAAARQDRNSHFKNTIAVFRMDNSYATLDSRIIGLPWSGGEEQFDPYVDFEIHCIVESFNPTGYYIICGSIRRGEAAAGVSGLVVVIDAGLNPLSIREYPEVKNFYSVYAQDNFYYVCGQTKQGQGIVLRDDVTNYVPTAQAYVTQQQWDYQKIRVRNSPGRGEIGVSGSFVSEDEPGEMGYTSFNATATNFSPIPNASWKFPPVNNHSIESKVVIANYPGAGGLGLILSVSDVNGIYTYLFVNYQTPTLPLTLPIAFKIPCYGSVLEDIDCAGDDGITSSYQIAWIGNYPQQTAYFANMNFPPQPMPFPFPTTAVRFIDFNPVPTTDNAYYSLRKVHYYKLPGDGKFHAGGYYYHNDGNKTTFAVTPELVLKEECTTEREEETVSLVRPRLTFHSLIEMEVSVNELKKFSKKYHFCTMDCQGENDCGNR